MASRYINDKIRKKVLKRDNYKCRYCGKDVSNGNYHLDHVYPVDKGGETSPENLVVSCPHCNLTKSNKVGIWPSDIVEVKTKIYVPRINYFPIVLSLFIILISIISATLSILFSNIISTEIIKTIFTISIFGMILGLGSLIGLTINAK